MRILSYNVIRSLSIKVKNNNELSMDIPWPYQKSLIQSILGKCLFQLFI